MGTIGEMIELPGLKVTVDRLLYQRLRADQSDKPHSFIYFISIHNHSPVTVTLRGRKWVVTHEDDTVLVVEGDGVVGETPVISPGTKFSYNSNSITLTNCKKKCFSFLYYIFKLVYFSLYLRCFCS